MLMKALGYGTKGSSINFRSMQHLCKQEMVDVLELVRQPRGGGDESIVTILKQFYAY
jgi:hypothetical protein